MQSQSVSVGVTGKRTACCWQWVDVVTLSSMFTRAAVLVSSGS